MLRRPRTGPAGRVGAEAATRRFGELQVDPQAREVRLEGEPAALTRTEFDVLDALSAHPRQAFTRAQLIERV